MTEEEDSESLLIYAAENDDMSAFEQALDSGVAMEAINTAFVTALAANSARVAEALLVEGADANTDMGGGLILLHHAISNQFDLDMIELLLENVDDLDAEDGSGNTALHYAISTGNVAIAEALLEAGANPNAQNNHGETPLHDAFCKDHAAMANLLLDHHADINIKSNKNRTPIDCIYEYQGYGVDLTKRKHEYLEVLNNKEDDKHAILLMNKLIDIYERK